jgi:hypothetical protein
LNILAIRNADSDLSNASNFHGLRYLLTSQQLVSAANDGALLIDVSKMVNLFKVELHNVRQVRRLLPPGANETAAAASQPYDLDKLWEFIKSRENTLKDIWIGLPGLDCNRTRFPGSKVTSGGTALARALLASATMPEKQLPSTLLKKCLYHRIRVDAVPWSLYLALDKFASSSSSLSNFDAWLSTHEQPHRAQVLAQVLAYMDAPAALLSYALRYSQEKGIVRDVFERVQLLASASSTGSNIFDAAIRECDVSLVSELIKIGYPHDGYRGSSWGPRRSLRSVASNLTSSNTDALSVIAGTFPVCYI